MVAGLEERINKFKYCNKQGRREALCTKLAKERYVEVEEVDVRVESNVLYLWFFEYG